MLRQLLINLSLVIFFSNCTTLGKPSITDIDFKVYSMVFSGKYFNPTEKKIFFFAIPFSFATHMKIDSNNTVLLNFNHTENFKEMFKILKEQGSIAKNSTFAELLQFSDDFKNLNISLDFATHSKFKLALVEEYQNKTFKSFRIKITKENSKVPTALYITFDLAKGETKEDEMDCFSGFLKEIKGNAQSKEILKFLE